MNIIEPNFNWNGLAKRASTKYIALHHAEASSCSVYDIDAWHKQNGWSGIGYHFFVRKNGEIYRGRPLDSLGAHVQGMNNCSLGICAEGSYMTETMPDVQKKAIADLIAYLKSNNYPDAEVVGHREIGSSDCPGKNFPLEELKKSSGSVSVSASTSSDSTKPKVLLNNSTGGINVKESFKNGNGEYTHAILVDGQNISLYVGDLTWGKTIEDLATSMSFSVAKTDMQHMHLASLEVGGIVSLFTNIEIFRGMIVSVDDSDRFVNKYTVFDFGWHLNKSKETYQFNGVPADDAIRQICNDFEINIALIPDLSKTIITQIYLDKSVSEIFDDILEQCDKVYTYDVIPSGLRIYELGSIYSYPEFRITPNTPLLYSPDYKGNVSHSISIEDMKNSVKVVAESDEAYTVSKVLRDDDSIYKYGLLQEVITVDPQKESVEIVAKNNFAQLNKAKESYSAEFIESIESYTMAGYRLVMEDKEFVIQSVEHSITNGVHYFKAELIRYSEDLLTKPESSAIQQTTNNGNTGTASSYGNSDSAWVTKWNATCYGWVGDDNGVCGWKSIRFRAANSNTILISGNHVAIPTYCVRQSSLYNDAWAQSDFPELSGGYGTVLEIRSPETGKTCRAVVADCGNFGPHNKYNHNTALDLAPNTLNALGLSKGTHNIEYRVIGKVDTWDGGYV